MSARCCILAALCALAAGDGAWTRVEAPFTPQFPRDHGAHLDARTEWWYATGEVEDEVDGRRFGYQLTIFRQGLDPRAPRAGESALRPRHVLAGHLAIVDVAGARLESAERARRAGLGLAVARAGDLELVLDDWEMTREPGGTMRLVAADRDARIGIALALDPTKDPVLHGAGGVSRKGPEPGNASIYASWTRVATRGTLTFDGREHRVRGSSWFDHEWGSSQLGPGIVGWDWFGLRLDDGREVMIYRLRSNRPDETGIASGTIVSPEGRATYLDARDFALEALETWTSPRTRAAYPRRFRLSVERAGIEIEIQARVPDCEIDATRSTGTIYWEGPVRVTGSAVGSGYGELTGYARSLAGKF